jgi:hypothetical protein
MLLSESTYVPWACLKGILPAVSAGRRLKQYRTLFAAARLCRQRYNVFGILDVEPKDMSTASLRGLCLFIRGTGLLNLC